MPDIAQRFYCCKVSHTADIALPSVMIHLSVYFVKYLIYSKLYIYINHTDY